MYVLTYLCLSFKQVKKKKTQYARTYARNCIVCMHVIYIYVHTYMCTFTVGLIHSHKSRLIDSFIHSSTRPSISQSIIIII